MDHEDKSKVRIDHIISFGDAIFAFSITFMALSIQFPISQSEILTQQEIISKLLDLQPQFETYAISFFIVGIYWISYHSLFNYITKSHSITTWLNLLFLFFITLISFTTSLQINYGVLSYNFYNILNSFDYYWSTVIIDMDSCKEF